MGAIQFIENLDRTTLTVSDAEFEKNVEAAVSAIAERHEAEVPLPIRHPVSEKSGPSEPEMMPGNSIEAEYISHRRPISSRGGTVDRSFTADKSDESTAVSGLLRTIQKPLSSIGRIFSDDPSMPPNPGSKRQSELKPQPRPPARLSPDVFQPPRSSSDGERPEERTREIPNPNQNQGSKLNAEDAAARQASAEAAEAQRIQRDEHNDVVELVSFASIPECANSLPLKDLSWDVSRSR